MNESSLFIHLNNIYSPTDNNRMCHYFLQKNETPRGGVSKSFWWVVDSVATLNQAPSLAQIPSQSECRADTSAAENGLPIGTIDRIGNDIQSGIITVSLAIRRSVERGDNDDIAILHIRGQRITANNFLLEHWDTVDRLGINGVDLCRQHPGGRNGRCNCNFSAAYVLADRGVKLDVFRSNYVYRMRGCVVNRHEYHLLSR